MERYNSFDGLRTLSALGIAMMHYLENVSVAQQLKDSSALYSTVIMFQTHLVLLFFILSAFSMCCGYFNRFETKDGRSSFDVEKFYSKRYARIWPFFAILVALDFVMNPSMEELYQCFADLTLAFNLLPNPEIHVIGVGWFLGVVFVFYMIFPWFAYLLQNKKRAWLAMATALILHFLTNNYFLTEDFVLPSEIGNYRHNIVWSFPFFMVGGIIYLYRKTLGNQRLKYIWLILSVGSLAYYLVFSPVIWGGKLIFLLLVFALWVAYAMTGGISIGGFKFLDNKVMKFLGNISMEVYLCHMVLYRVVEKLHFENYLENPHLYYWTVVCLGVSLAVLFSWIVKCKVFPFVGTRIQALAFLK